MIDPVRTPHSSTAVGPRALKPAELCLIREDFVKKVAALGAKASAAAIAEVAREALGIQSLLNGGGFGGVRSHAESRVKRAKSALGALERIRDMAADVYAQPVNLVVRVLIADFVGRVESGVGDIREAHATMAITSCLEQSRLLIIFAGRAQRSQEHVNSALSGLKEKGMGEEAPAGPKGKKEALDPSERHAAFERRQAERLAATEEKRKLVKSGAAIPVERTKPKVERDEYTAELLKNTVREAREMAEAAHPTAEQKRLLALKDSAGLESRLGTRLSKTNKKERADELEQLRVDIINEVANTFRSWMEDEIALAKDAGRSLPSEDSIPYEVLPAKERLEKCERDLEAATELSAIIERTLYRLGKTIAPLRGQFEKALTASELNALERAAQPTAADGSLPLL